VKEQHIYGFAAIHQISQPASELDRVVTLYVTTQKKYYLKYESLKKGGKDAQNREEVDGLTELLLSLAWLV